MACFRKNCLIRSEYVKRSDGYRRMFFRKAGTEIVIAEGKSAAFHTVKAGESVIVIQWEGSPGYDSGYYAEAYPATMKGLRAAHWRMNALLT